MPRRLSEPLTTLADELEHPVYFNGWDMRLDPQDDTTGYEGRPAVVGQLRLDRDGWFNYFGFPEKPMPESPFEFRHSGTKVKALTYGNLGTGGLSRAAFEQTLPDDHPERPVHPGLRHALRRAPGDRPGRQLQRARGLPRPRCCRAAPPACTATLTGDQASVNVASGVTCLDNATVSGNVTVAAGASVVVKKGTIGGTLNANGAEAVQLFGSTVTGAAQVRNTTRDVTIAGSTFRGGLALTGNTQVSANERYSRLAGAYGPILAGSTIYGLSCADNSAEVSDFGAPNSLRGSQSGGGACTGPVSVDSPVGGTVPATLSLSLGTAANFGAFTPGVARDYFAATTANVITTAGNAALSVADPSSTATGRLVNGAFSLPTPLQARARNAANPSTSYANVGSSASPLTLLGYGGPASNDAVTLEFKQSIGANDALRTGAYGKTLTFTLSTTMP